MSLDTRAGPLQLVWFKRDLRVADHAPLSEAAARGPVLPLYLIEPGLWAQADAAARHWGFVRESLLELDTQLSALGQPLLVMTGEAEMIIAQLLRQHRIAAVWSHQETGNAWTFKRDRRVAALLRQFGIPWHQLRQHGIERGAAIDRDGWAARWTRLMRSPIAAPPRALPRVANPPARSIPDHPPGLAGRDAAERQRGGRNAGQMLLESFLEDRGRDYAQRMSAPHTAQQHCSRLSPHLAYGTLSIREIYQAVRRRREQLNDLPPSERGGWPRSLSAFESRLRWHCHFMQKLETEPRIEFENMHRGFDGLREDTPDSERFEAWCNGRTGWPLVDACMRALATQGWINFRMRAMLMAVSSYHLWQHWRAPALHLARLFTDYEPGIHYPQAQMQSGTTGINALRIYNPVKQSRELDPQGAFLRRWVPELQAVPDEWIHTPWLLSPAQQRRFGVRLDKDYPRPPVDHEEAARSARRRIVSWRREHLERAETQRILKQHASRKRPAAHRSRTAGKQGDLFE